jgi:hypothetical protein
MKPASQPERRSGVRRRPQKMSLQQSQLERVAERHALEKLKDRLQVQMKSAQQMRLGQFGNSTL